MIPIAIVEVVLATAQRFSLPLPAAVREEQRGNFICCATLPKETKNKNPCVHCATLRVHRG